MKATVSRVGRSVVVKELSVVGCQLSVKHPSPIVVTKKSGETGGKCRKRSGIAGHDLALQIAAEVGRVGGQSNRIEIRFTMPVIVSTCLEMNAFA